jgi:acyl carrier protein
MSAPTPGAVLAQLQEICREVFEDPGLEVSPETSAEHIPGWDSFNHVNVVIAAEQRFGVRFRSAEVESLRNIGEFVDLVLAKRGAA